MKKIVQTIFFICILFLALTLPLVLPTMQLYSKSYRQQNGISFTQGSLAPIMMGSVFYPYLFGGGEDYVGTSINSDYLKHEVYIYVGITSLIFGFFGFFLMREKRLLLFLSSLILLFLILGFIEYVPFINKMYPFPFFLFRYWVRSVVVFVFSVALYAAYFVSFLMSKKIVVVKKEILSKLKLLLVSVFYLMILQLFNLFDATTIEILKHLTKGRFHFDIFFWIWLVMIFVSLLFLFLIRSVTKHKDLSKESVLKGMACAIIFIDIFFFSHDVLNVAFIETKSLVQVISVLESFKNKRVVVLDGAILGNKGLYYKNWGVFGYSQFTPEKYKAYLKSFGFKRTKGPDLRMCPYNENFIKSLYGLGISGVLKQDPYGSFYVTSRNDNYLINSDDIDVTFLQEEEGHIKARLLLEDARKLKTFIRNDSNWELKIDNVNTPVLNKDKLYLEFDVTPGEHIIELKYVPKKFYEGLTYSFILGVGSTLLAKKQRLI